MKYPPTVDYDEAGSFTPPLTPGDYTVTLVDVRGKNDKGEPYTNKGYPAVLFDFDIDGHPDNKLFERFVFDLDYEYHNQTMGKFKQMLMAFGMPTEVAGDTDALIGKRCIATVKNSESKGRIYNNILQYTALGQEEQSPSTQREVPNF